MAHVSAGSNFPTMERRRNQINKPEKTEAPLASRNFRRQSSRGRQDPSSPENTGRKQGARQGLGALIIQCGNSGALAKNTGAERGAGRAVLPIFKWSGNGRPPSGRGPQRPIWTGGGVPLSNGENRLNTSKFVGHPLGRKMGSIPQFLCRPRRGQKNGLNTANATRPENRLNTAVRVGHEVSGASITSATRGAMEYIHPILPSVPGKGRMPSSRL